MQLDRVRRLAPVVLAVLLGVALVGAQTSWGFIDSYNQWFGGDTGVLLLALAGWAIFVVTRSQPVMALALGHTLVLIMQQLSLRLQVQWTGGTAIIMPVSLIAAMYLWGGGLRRVQVSVGVLTLISLGYAIAISTFEPGADTPLIPVWGWLDIAFWTALLIALWVIPHPAPRWLSLSALGQLGFFAVAALSLTHERLMPAWQVCRVLVYLGYGLTFWSVYRSHKAKQTEP